MESLLEVRAHFRLIFVKRVCVYLSVSVPFQTVQEWEEMGGNSFFFFSPVLALMWPSFESAGGGKKCALPAKKINKKQHLALKCSFSREAGGIRRSSVGFTETYEGSLSGRRAHTRSRLIVLTAGKHRRRLPLCVCSCSAEASPCTSETG